MARWRSAGWAASAPETTNFLAAGHHPTRAAAATGSERPGVKHHGIASGAAEFGCGTEAAEASADDDHVCLLRQRFVGSALRRRRLPPVGCRLEIRSETGSARHRRLREVSEAISRLATGSTSRSSYSRGNNRSEQVEERDGYAASAAPSVRRIGSGEARFRWQRCPRAHRSRQNLHKSSSTTSWAARCSGRRRATPSTVSSRRSTASASSPRARLTSASSRPWCRAGTSSGRSPRSAPRKRCCREGGAARTARPQDHRPLWLSEAVSRPQVHHAEGRLLDGDGLSNGTRSPAARVPRPGPSSGT